jgi:hypothetical protein
MKKRNEEKERNARQQELRQEFSVVGVNHALEVCFGAEVQDQSSVQATRAKIVDHLGLASGVDQGHQP